MDGAGETCITAVTLRSWPLSPANTSAFTADVDFTVGETAHVLSAL